MSKVIIRSSETTVMGLTDENEIVFRINRDTWKGEAYNKDYEKAMESIIKLMNPTGE